MENRELVIERAHGLVRAAILENGQLCELHSEREAGDTRTETLYYGRVQAIRPSLHAAFVDIGEERNAFLPLEEGEAPRCGSWLIVQGTARQTTKTKGLRVTRRIQLAGRFLVLVPGETGIHLSRKIAGEALRSELYRMAQAACPEGCALIVRTATEGLSMQALEEEAQALRARWDAAVRKSLGMVRPGVLEKKEPLELRLARDLAGGGLSRIVTNSEACIQALGDAVKAGKIAQDTRIERFEERTQLLFDALNLETQIDKALKRRVWLPCGGYLVIDFCEAMTVVDVNSGKMTLGRDVEDTALRVNLEAVRETARQMRLRDVGGIIVLDLIDMQREKDREAVLAAMEEAAVCDRSQVHVEGFTRLGLLELTRKRKEEQLRKRLCTTCGTCRGTGEVLGGGEAARRALWQVRRMALSGQRGPFVIQCAAAAAQALEEMGAPAGVEVYALAMPGRHPERFDVEQLGEGDPPPKGAKRLQTSLDQDQKEVEI